MDRNFSDSAVAPAAQAPQPPSADHRRDAAVVRMLTAPPAIDPSPAFRDLVKTAHAERALAIKQALADIRLTSEISEEVCAAIEDHAEEAARFDLEPIERDEDERRHWGRKLDTDAALQAAPVRSLADIRAKLTYLLPIILPDVNGTDYRAHLTAIAGDIDKLCRERSRPVGHGGDAELLRLGEELDRAHARWRVACHQAKGAHQRITEGMIALRGKRGDEAAYSAIYEAPEVKGPMDAEAAAAAAVWPIANAIWATPHSTPAGLAVKARAALVDTFNGGSYEADAALGQDEDLPAKGIRSLIEACCTLAGVDWRGDPIAPPRPDPIHAAPVANTDPIHAAIGTHHAAAVALAVAAVAQDEAVIARDGGDTSDAAMASRRAAYEVAGAAEVAGWNALFTAPPTTLQGVVALIRHVGHSLADHVGPAGAIGADEALYMAADALDGMAQPAPVAIAVQTEPDPILAAIAASREIEAAADALDDAHESDLADQQSAAMKAAFATVPTTWAGIQALAAFADFHVSRTIGPDWRNEARQDFYGESLLALVNAIEAGRPGDLAKAPDIDPASPYEFARREIANADWSAIDLSSLCAIAEDFHAAYDRWGDLLPHRCYDASTHHDYREPTPAGRIVEREEQRAGFIRDSIFDEIRRRTPADEAETDGRLEALIRFEVMCNGSLRQAPDLRAEVNAAWGA